ncbi:MFS transporter [Roseomonas elaeocarpi]|uniref:MFS transporter n=1 Tax=Roseomonas elaeocarpi TaxID=907779 RepID=A0ABV6JPD9_9PROT
MGKGYAAATVRFTAEVMQHDTASPPTHPPASGGAAARDPGAANRRRLPVLAAASFATSTQIFVVAGLLREMATDLDVPVSQAGQVATALAMAFGLTAPFVAALTAPWPRRRLLTSALLLLALLNLAIVFSGSFPTLLGLRVLCGIAAAAVVPTAAATAAALVPPEERGRAIATVVAGSTAALLFGVPMGSVAGAVFGWRGAFGLAAVLSLLGAVAIRLVLPEVPGERSGLRGLRLLRSPGVGRTVAVTFLGFGASFCLSAFIGPAVNRVSGLVGSQVAIMQSLAGLASLVGLPVGAWMAGRSGIRGAWVLTGLMALSSSGHALLLAGAADGTGLAIPLQGLAILVSGGCAFALSPLLQTHLVSLVPDGRGVVLAANSSAMFLGQAGGALVAGAALGCLSLPGLGVAGATLAGLATIVGLTLRRH